MELQVKQAEKWYFRASGSANRFYAVEKTDLTLAPGTLTVLTGRSGSGKTTLLHMMAGLLRPDGGTICVDGQDLYAMDDKILSRFRNRHFGVIPQSTSAIPNLTVMENILLPGRLYKKAGAAANQPAQSGSAQDRAHELLARFSIDSLATSPCKELSGGELRRMAVIRALMGVPDFIFADEPTSDLDDGNMQLVLAALRKEADRGAAVFIVTHDIEAVDYADLHLQMSDHRILEERTKINRTDSTV